MAQPLGIRTPRSLRISKPNRKMNARDRKRTARSRRTANRELADAGNLWMPRSRMFQSVQTLFKWAKVTAPEEFVERKVRELGHNRKCSVLEIGAGYGGALGIMLLDPRIGPIAEHIELHGLDIFRPKEAPGIIWHHGSALTTPFPKADLIFSQVSAGYVGQIGFIVKKAADALHNGGLAVLHVNKFGMPNDPSALIKDVEKLEQNMHKLKRDLGKMSCEIATQRGFFRDQQYWSDDDLAIIIRKK